MKVIRVVLVGFVLVGTIFGKSFDNVLLIINYNHAHYDSIPFITNIYKEYFPNIVFYGPKQDRKVHYYPHNRGFFSYMCIVDAMRKYPDYEGYLFLMDDCILHAWLLEGFDTTKIWFSDILFHTQARGNPIDLALQEKATSWVWWAGEFGYKPMTRAFNDLPAAYKNQLAQNWGPNHVVAAFSDLLYLPARLKDQFIEVAATFGKYNAFLETALPTIISCISSKEDWLWLKGNGTCMARYQNAWYLHNVEVFFNHPIKLSQKENRNFVEKLFAAHK